MKASYKHETLLLLALLSDNVLELMLHSGSIDDGIGVDSCHTFLGVIKHIKDIINEEDEVTK